MNFWSVNIVKVLWYSESFVQVAVLETELLLCPGFDRKNIIWKRMNVKHDTHMMQKLIHMKTTQLRNAINNCADRNSLV